MAVFQTTRRNVLFDMLNFWALKVLIFKILGSNMVVNIKRNSFKPKTRFSNFDFCPPLGALCSVGLNSMFSLVFIKTQKFS